MSMITMGMTGPLGESTGRLPLRILEAVDGGEDMVPYSFRVVAGRELFRDPFACILLHLWFVPRDGPSEPLDLAALTVANEPSVGLTSLVDGVGGLTMIWQPGDGGVDRRFDLGRQRSYTYMFFQGQGESLPYIASVMAGQMRRIVHGDFVQRHRWLQRDWETFDIEDREVPPLDAMRIRDQGMLRDGMTLPYPGCIALLVGGPHVGGVVLVDGSTGGGGFVCRRVGAAVGQEVFLQQHLLTGSPAFSGAVLRGFLMVPDVGTRVEVSPGHVTGSDRAMVGTVVRVPNGGLGLYQVQVDGEVDYDEGWLHPAGPVVETLQLERCAFRVCLAYRMDIEVMAFSHHDGLTAAMHQAHGVPPTD